MVSGAPPNGNGPSASKLNVPTISPYAYDYVRGDFSLERLGRWNIMQGADGRRLDVDPDAMDGIESVNVENGTGGMGYGGLPRQDEIKAIHVYDFDNTLFLTPLPNSRIWHGLTLSHLQAPDWLENGGWWHDSRILAATGQGLEAELPRAWAGYWNEHVVSLVRLSMEQKDAITVLLTGRARDRGFPNLIRRIVSAKGLKFDIIALKPVSGSKEKNGGIPVPGGGWHSTLGFKCVFLEDLLGTYRDAEEIRIYEDRASHAASFKEWLSVYTSSAFQRRSTLKAEVIEVADDAKSLDGAVEIKEVQKMVEEHNAIKRRKEGDNCVQLKVKQTVFLTGYMLNAEETKKVQEQCKVEELVQDSGDRSEVKILANNVLITPRPATKGLIQKLGGFGLKIEFEVVGIGCFDEKVWAAHVQPVDPKVTIYTDNPRPIIVLAHRRNAKPVDAGLITNFIPPNTNAPIRFTATVGEKVLLRIEEEDEYEGTSPRITHHPSFPRGGSHYHPSAHQNPTHHHYRSRDESPRRYSHDDRGFGRENRDRGGGRGFRGRGRSGRDRGGAHNTQRRGRGARGGARGGTREEMEWMGELY